MSVKEKIYELVERMDDEKQMKLLEQIKQMLESKLDPILKEKLTQSALRANEDIKAGRVHSIDEARQIINNRLGL